MSQGTRDVSAYYTELKSLWDELESFRPFSLCTCAIPCTCSAVQNVKKFRDQDYTIRFLKGLNEEFSHVRSQIMMMDPFPQITKAFSLVIQQKRNINISNPPSSGTETENDTKTTSIVNHVQSSNRGGYGNRGRGRFGQGSTRLCTHCNKTNHTVETCYFLHGFPPGYQTRTQKNSTNSAASQNESNKQENGNGFDNNVPLIQDQYKAILELIQQSKQRSQGFSHSVNTVLAQTSTPSQVSSYNIITDPVSGMKFIIWIVDTGATDHIVPDLSLFTSYKLIDPIKINFPNHTTAFATAMGLFMLPMT